MPPTPLRPVRLKTVSGVATRIMRTVLLVLTLFNISCAAPAEHPERRLSYYLAMPTARGNVFAQGTLDGVDYRNLLRGAIAKDSVSLSGIFRYTANGHLMGEGADTNCEILLHLLHTWGDTAYANVLAAESPKVRSAVIDALDYTWSHPGWQASEFPISYRLAKHIQRRGGGEGSGVRQ